MSTDKAFISIAEDGGVTIDGGLIFHHGAFLHSEPRTDSADGPTHRVFNTVSYSTLPRWWQIGQWRRLLQALRANTGGASCA